MTGLSPRLAALFAGALLGVLVVLGLALSPLGWAAETAYLLVVGTGLGLLLRRARGLRKPAEGSTCSCCTSTVFDPVEVR